MPAAPRPALTKRLVRHGNSLAVVLDRALLDVVGISEETPISIRTDGHCLVLTPVGPDDRVRRVRASMEKVHRRYARTLKRLAE